jgi:hypothetical protein
MASLVQTQPADVPIEPQTFAAMEVVGMIFV